MDLFSTTYFGEIIIFVVSKDQTFKIRSTLMNPEQFLILVTHLVWKQTTKIIKLRFSVFLRLAFGERSVKAHKII